VSGHQAAKRGRFGGDDGRTQAAIRAWCRQSGSANGAEFTPGNPGKFGGDLAGAGRPAMDGCRAKLAFLTARGHSTRRAGQAGGLEVFRGQRASDVAVEREGATGEVQAVLESRRPLYASVA
jgi:hypothetical protein